MNTKNGILRVILLFLLGYNFIIRPEFGKENIIIPVTMVGLVGTGILLYEYKHNNKLKEYVYKNFNNIKKLFSKKKMIIYSSLLAAGGLSVLYYLKKDNIIDLNPNTSHPELSCPTQNPSSPDLSKHEDSPVIVPTGILKSSDLIAGRRNKPKRKDIREVHFEADFKTI